MMQRLFQGLPSLAVWIGVTATLFATGCDQSDSSPLAGPARERGAVEAPAITLSDLPADLRLTDPQARQMEDALGSLAERRRGMHDRVSRGDGWGRREEPPIISFLERSSEILTPDQFQVLARFLSERRAEMRPRAEAWARHEGGRGLRGLGARMGLGLDASQRAGVEAIVRSHAEAAQDVLEELENGTVSAEEARDRIRAIRKEGRSQAAALLGEEKMAKADAFRRDRMGERIADHMEQMGSRLPRRADFIGRVLGLTSAQTEQVRSILGETAPARQQVLEELRAGTIEPEDAALEIARVEKETAEKIRALLDGEQAARWDAIRDLLPRGFQRFGRER